MSPDPPTLPSDRQLKAIRLTEEQAHQVWSQSAEATAFTRPANLSRLAEEVEWWGAERSGKLLAAWPLVRATRGGPFEVPPFCYYIGPLFIRSVREDRNRARGWNTFTDCLTLLAGTIAEAHPEFSFTLPPGLDDVRVLSWWNHDHPTETGFVITPRYTARIDLSQFADEPALSLALNSDRRRRINRWAMTPPSEYNEVDTGRVIELHDEALRRSGGQVTPERRLALIRMTNLIRSGAGSILGFAPSPEPTVHAVILLLDGPDTTNNVFCAASDVYRKSGLTSWAVWRGLQRSRARGLRWFDMNGANSPKRARDKHSYGAQTELYFDCHLRRGGGHPRGA